MTDPAAGPARLPPTLFLVIDAVPFDVADEVWRGGGMPGFAAPRPMVSVFPALTHVAVPALLEGTFHERPPGYEIRWLHPPTGELRGGFDEPGAEAGLDPFRVRPEGVLGHGSIYPLPWAAAWAQIRWITHRYRTEGGPWLAYLWASDAVAHFEGRAQLVDTFADVCAQVQQVREEVAARDGVLPEVVLASDHGMAFGRLDHLGDDALAAHLRVFGLAEDAPGPDQVRLVPFGDVSAGVVYCDPARADHVAEAVATAPGVELAFSRTPDGFRAWRARGRLERATVRVQGGVGGRRWSYHPEAGDPLDLAPLWATLTDADGLAADDALLAATAGHRFPDPLHRVLHGMTELVRWPAPVLFSMAPGHTYGPAWTHAAAELLGGQVGTHGALDRAASVGFAACTFSTDPWPGRAVLRPSHVFAPWGELLRAGAKIPRV